MFIVSFSFTKSSPDTMYVDIAVKNSERFLVMNKNLDSRTYHLITHGRPGQLLINGEWMNAEQISNFLKPKIQNLNACHSEPVEEQIKNLNIYGCEFGKGEEGIQAVKYIENKLGIKVAASTNVTGIDGDYLLEVGNMDASTLFEGFQGNLQLVCSPDYGIVPGPNNQYASSAFGGYPSGNYGTTVNNNGVGEPNGVGIAIYNNTPSNANGTQYQGRFAYTNIFSGGSTVVITAKYIDSRHDGITLEFSTDNSTWVGLTPVINGFTSNYTNVTYTLPSNLRGQYKYIRVQGVSASTYLNVDAIRTNVGVCNTCPARLDAPALSSTTVTVTCPSQTYSLNTITASNTPANTVLTWHTGTPATNANKIANTSAVAEGIYYAAFYNSSNDCYSGINGSATTQVKIVGDADCDGVPDVNDLDDDNDGVLDTTEQKLDSCEEDIEAENKVVNWTMGSGNTSASGQMSSDGQTLTVTASTTKTFNSIRNEHWSYGTGQYIGCPEVDAVVTNSAINIFTNNYTVTFSFSQPVRNPVLTVSSFNGSKIDFPHPVYVTGLQGNVTGVSLGSYISSYPATENKASFTYNGIFNSISFTVPNDDIQGAVMLFVQEIEDSGTATYVNSSGDPFSYRNIDSDGDGKFNHQDLDSDDDGCSDALEAGATTDLAPNYTFPTTNVGSNGLHNSLETSPEDSGMINYASTYEQYALNDNIKVCADTDGDGILDLSDIDDDNDGVPDATESPNCYFTAKEMGVPTSITTTVAHSGTIANLYDNNLSTLFRFTNGTTKANRTVFEITPKQPVIARAIQIEMNNLGQTEFSNTANSLRVDGWNGTTWVTLMPAFNPSVSPNDAQGYYQTFNFTQNQNAAYSKFRLQGLAGTIVGSDMREVRLLMPRKYVASRYPKATCTDANIDGDNKAPHLDLDSDGDVCSDAREAGATTNTSANYQFPDIDGNNDGLVDAVDANEDGHVDYKSSYLQYGLNQGENLCEDDTDGDGIADLIDIDDDNDGVTDIEECPSGVKVIVPEGFKDLTTLLVSGENPPDALYNDYGLILNMRRRAPYYDLFYNKVNTISHTGGVDNRFIFFQGGQQTTYSFEYYNPETNQKRSVDKIVISAETNADGSLVSVVAFNEFDEVIFSKHDYQDGSTYTVTTSQTTNNSKIHRFLVYGSNNTTAFDNLYIQGVTTFDGDCDSDNDGTPNHLDPDSDNDGCSDAFEAGATKDLTTNFQFPTTNVGANGLHDPLETSTDSGKTNYNSTYNEYALNDSIEKCTDTDGDKVADIDDLDDDNDGLLDCEEGINATGGRMSVTNIDDATKTASFTHPSGEVITNVEVITGVGAEYGSSSQELRGTNDMLNGNMNMRNNQGEVIFKINQLRTGNVEYLFKNRNEDPYGTTDHNHFVLEYNASLFNATLVSGTIDGVSVGGKIESGVDYKKNSNYVIKIVSIYPIISGTVYNFSHNYIFTGNAINQESPGLAMISSHCYDIDTDNDGIPNRIDLDSDGDDCPDIKEAGVAGYLRSIGELSKLTSGDVTNGNNVDDSENTTFTMDNARMNIFNDGDSIGPNNGFHDVLEQNNAGVYDNSPYTFESYLNSTINKCRKVYSNPAMHSYRKNKQN